MIIEDLGERVNLIENNKYNRTLLDAILETDHDYPEVFNIDLFCLVANKTNYEILNLLDEDNYNLFHKIIIEGYGRDDDDIYRMLNFILPKVNPNLINQQAKNGKTVLHCVISSPVYGNIEIYKFLLNNMDIKAINYKDYSGKTALHYAILTRHLPTCEVIAKYMSDENIGKKDENGNTVLHYANTSYDKEIYRWLKDKGLMLDVKNNNGETPDEISPLSFSYL